MLRQIYSTLDIFVNAYIVKSMNPGPKSSGLVPLFAALADPTRLRLLNLIAGREVCVCYLVEILQQS
jgi:hypothetical protein